MKVANIIVAHKNPDQLLRMIRLFDGKLFHHFVHIDKRANLDDWKEIAAHPDVTMLPVRYKLVYAGYGFVAATLEAFEIIRASSERYFYYNLISGMDFPIRPTSEFYDHLKQSHEEGPFEFFEILDLSVWPGEHRYRRYHLIEWDFKGRYFTERLINKYVVKPRQFYGGKFVPYGRAAWFTASDRFVEFAIDYFAKNPEYIRFLKTCWSPDEFIFNTLIMNSPFRGKIRPYLRYIDWSEGKVTPRVFRKDDFQTLRDSGCFIARKFDEQVDREIISELEKTLSFQKAIR